VYPFFAVLDLAATGAASAQEPLHREKQSHKESHPTADRAQIVAERNEASDRHETIKRLMDGVSKLRAEANPAAAARRAAAMAEQFPTDPSVQANRHITDTANRVESNRQVQVDLERSIAGQLGGVDRSAITSGLDYQLPKDWVTKSQLRKRQSPLTAKEKEIVRTLDSDISVDFNTTPLKDVVDFLQDKLGEPITVDSAALKAAEISYDSPVTMNVKRISVRTFLKKILADIGLTYTIRDGSIEVTTPERARTANVARVFYMGDLLPLRADPYFYAAQLMDLIQSTVEPQSWRRNGGTGTIMYNRATNSIVVKQGVEVQSIISEAFH
jgi:hypothetical protein